jgi:polyferredoxin
MLAAGYRWKRRATQIGVLLIFILVPAFGIFRIDLADASLLILGHQVFLRNFSVVAGLAIIVATAPLLTYSTIGTIWCGWACPQNTVSEWANNLTHRLLGSRANVNVESAGLVVAPSKNRLANWLRLGASVVLASLVLGVIPLFYFFPPGVVWSLVSFGEQSQFSVFMHRLYFVGAVAVVVDIAILRHFWCNYLCVYRFGQLLFRSDEALHIAYDAGRSGECAKCNYCRVSCITGVDPTALKFFDRCINCGECIDACRRLHAKDEPPSPGLLRFDPGRRSGRRGWSGPLGWWLGKFGWPGAILLLGCAFLAYGLASLGK